MYQVERACFLDSTKVHLLQKTLFTQLDNCMHVSKDTQGLRNRDCIRKFFKPVVFLLTQAILILYKEPSRKRKFKIALRGLKPTFRDISFTQSPKENAIRIADKCGPSKWNFPRVALRQRISTCDVVILIFSSNKHPSNRLFLSRQFEDLRI